MAGARVPDFADRVRGMVLGAAFGDAVGATVEKLSAEAIRTRYGRVSGLDTPWHLENASPEERRGRIRGRGIVTDDTHMMLCLMAVYRDARRHLDAWDMADGMVREIAWRKRWLAELQREDMLLERLFYPERWIFIRHQLAGCEPREGGIGNMINCGAAMYIAPIGAVNAADPRRAYDEAIAFALGHQTSYGLEAAGVLAACVAAAFSPGAGIERVIEVALAMAKDGTRRAIADVIGVVTRLRGESHAVVTAAIHAALLPYSSMGDDISRGPDKVGRVSEDYRPSRLRAIEELPVALGFALLHDGEFRPSVLDGVNSGRDTDSIGAMAGAILGAMHGSSVLTAQEVALLDSANRLSLEMEAADFTEAALSILDEDRRMARALAGAREALGIPG
jgi:ADP-ribosylglycohydrolase